MLFFISKGNLIDAEKNLRENRASGEKYPGLAPKSWELIRRSKDGREQIVKKGVIDYCLAVDGLYYSNGSNVVYMQEGQAVGELVCEMKLAQNMVWIETLEGIK
jgi:hypothetical protein